MGLLDNLRLVSYPIGTDIIRKRKIVDGDNVFVKLGGRKLDLDDMADEAKSSSKSRSPYF